NVVTLSEEVHRLVWVVRSGDRVDWDRHRDAASRPHEGSGRAHSVGRDQIERPEFIVGTPAAPVLHRLKDLLELVDAYSGRRLRHGAAPFLVGRRRPPPSTWITFRSSIRCRGAVSHEIQRATSSSWPIRPSGVLRARLRYPCPRSAERPA